MTMNPLPPVTTRRKVVTDADTLQSLIEAASSLCANGGSLDDHVSVARSQGGRIVLETLSRPEPEEDGDRG